MLAPVVGTDECAALAGCEDTPVHVAAPLRFDAAKERLPRIGPPPPRGRVGVESRGESSRAELRDQRAHDLVPTPGEIVLGGDAVRDTGEQPLGELQVFVCDLKILRGDQPDGGFGVKDGGCALLFPAPWGSRVDGVRDVPSCLLDRYPEQLLDLRSAVPAVSVDKGAIVLLHGWQRHAEEQEERGPHRQWKCSGRL